MANKKKIQNPIKRFFNAKLWNNVKTRKIILVLSICMVVIYTVVGLILIVHKHDLNDELTTQYFSYAKWLVATGGLITVAKVIKGATNSDDDE
jgi:hypothetical protein